MTEPGDPPAGRPPGRGDDRVRGDDRSACVRFAGEAMVSSPAPASIGMRAVRAVARRRNSTPGRRRSTHCGPGRDGRDGEVRDGDEAIRQRGPRDRRALVPDRLRLDRPSAGRITQAELCEYHALKAEQARRSEEIGDERAALIRRLADGEPIEEGPYRARIHACQARVLSTPKLLEILPEDEVEELRNRVTPSPRVELLVTFVDEDEARTAPNSPKPPSRRYFPQPARNSVQVRDGPNANPPSTTAACATEPLGERVGPVSRCERPGTRSTPGIRRTRRAPASRTDRRVSLVLRRLLSSQSRWTGSVQADETGWPAVLPARAPGAREVA